MILLVVVHYPMFGGPHNRTLQLAQPLADVGWKTVALLPNEPGDAAKRLRHGGVEVIQAPLGRARATINPVAHGQYFISLGSQILMIRRLIKERRINAVLIGGLMNPHAAIAARLANVPLIWQIVDTRTPLLLRTPLMSLVNRLADTVMFNGKALIAQHSKKPLKLPTFEYFPPVDTKKRFVIAPYHRKKIKTQLGIPLESPVIGSVANINPQKGIEYFLRAASLIYKQVPEAWFLLVGTWYTYKKKYNKKIKEELDRSGLPASRIIFAGSQPNVEEYYPAMDVKLITSVPNSEGTTTTAMEAMACGIPVVATDVGAIREVVEDGITGYVVPPLQPIAIAEATTRILADESLKQRMREAARARAVSKFDISVCAEKHLEAIEASLYHYRQRSAKAN
ncbi:glycosyltransferase [Nitrosococcus oceani]|uniref:glycosyltransferase n=1 Tax=Nitrosococcus oceani TaxID=1229 RepID=UPI0004E87821|nr:glycosyltransferase [Nitrosococcus oceani]KFI22827.1 hypothetical protein HW44_07195 [Nitrosococcus oceani]